MAKHWRAVVILAVTRYAICAVTHVPDISDNDDETYASSPRALNLVRTRRLMLRDALVRKASGNKKTIKPGPNVRDIWDSFASEVEAAITATHYLELRNHPRKVYAHQICKELHFSSLEFANGTWHIQLGPARVVVPGQKKSSKSEKRKAARETITLFISERELATSPTSRLDFMTQMCFSGTTQWQPMLMVQDRSCVRDSLPSRPLQKRGNHWCDNLLFPDHWNWNPHHLPPSVLSKAYQRALNAVELIANITLTKDTLKLMAMTATEMLKANMPPVTLGYANNRYFVSVTINHLRIYGIEKLAEAQGDLFDIVEVHVKNGRLELIITSNDLNVPHKLSIELSLGVGTKHMAREFYVCANITSARLRAILSPEDKFRDNTGRFDAILNHSPWCVLNNAVLDLFVLEISVDALCVSDTALCWGEEEKLTTHATKALEKMLANLIKSTLSGKSLNMTAACRDNSELLEHGNNDGEALPLLNVAQLVMDAKPMLAPLVTELLKGSPFSLPHRIPSKHLWFTNIASLRNLNVTIRTLENVTFHSDSVMANAQRTKNVFEVEEEDDGHNSSTNHGILRADVTVGVIEVEFAMDFAVTPNNAVRPWTVKTRVLIHGIQSTIAARLLIPRFALNFTNSASDLFTPDWRCLLHKLRPSFNLSQIDIQHITSSTLRTTINDREAVVFVNPNIMLRAAHFFSATRLVGQRVFANHIFENIQCTAPPLKRNLSSQRYNVTGTKATMIEDFGPAAQMAVQAISVLVFNRAFFQFLLSQCVQWLKDEGMRSRIKGAENMFDNGAGLVDLDIVDGRIVVITHTPPERPITITLEKSMPALFARIQEIFPLSRSTLVPSMSPTINAGFLRAHAVVDQIQFQLLFHVNREVSAFLGKPVEWWVSGCALQYIDIDLAVLQVRVRRLCFRLSCGEEMRKYESAFIRSVTATLVHATLQKAFGSHMRQKCIESLAQYHDTPEAEETMGPLPPQFALAENGWKHSVRWRKNDLVRFASEIIKRSVPYYGRNERENAVVDEEGVSGMLTVSSLMELLHHQGRIILLPTKTSLDVLGRKNVRVDVSNLVLYAPQKYALSVSGYTILSVTGRAERDALVARLDDTSWKLRPLKGTNDVLGLPTDARLLQVRERSTNTWHHRHANDVVVHNKSVTDLLRSIAIDGTTTLTFAHAANVSVRYTNNDTTLFAARFDHVSMEGVVHKLTVPLVPMEEDVIVQENASGSEVRAYAGCVTQREWRYIWSTEIAHNGVAHIIFDLDAYVVSHGPVPAMDGVYSRVGDVWYDNAMYSNDHFKLHFTQHSQRTGGVWELRNDEIVLRSRTSNPEGTWDFLGLSVRKVATNGNLSATVTLVYDDAIFPHTISPRSNVSGMRLDVVKVDDDNYSVHFTNWTHRDTTTRANTRFEPAKHSSSFTYAPKSSHTGAPAPRMRIRIHSNNTLLLIRRSTPTIGFDVLNADDVSLGASIGLSNVTMTIQGASSMERHSPGSLHPFHVGLHMRDFHADARVFLKADERFFDIPGFFLNGLTACHHDYLTGVRVHTLNISSYITSVSSVPRDAGLLHPLLHIQSGPENGTKPPFPGKDWSTFATGDMDHALLSDLSNLIVNALALPLVNQIIISVTGKTGACENTTTRHKTRKKSHTLAIMSCCFFLLGCLSVTVGYATCSGRRNADAQAAKVARFGVKRLGSLAFHPGVPRSVRVAIPLFVISLACGLLATFFSPLYKNVAAFQIDDDMYGVVHVVCIPYSILCRWDALKNLWARQHCVIFKVTYFCSAFSPFLKCALLLVVWCMPSHVVPLRWRSRLINFLRMIGKLALVNVFLAIFKVKHTSVRVTRHSSPHAHTSFNFQFSTESEFYLFTACVGMSLFILDVVARYHRQDFLAIEQQRTLSSSSSLQSSLSLDDMQEYYLMLRLAHAPTTAAHIPLPITRTNVPRAFSLGSFYRQATLARIKRLLENVQATVDSRRDELWLRRAGPQEVLTVLRGFMALDRVWWTQRCVLHVQAREQYIMPALLSSAFVLLYLTFVCGAMDATYGGAVGYLMSDGLDDIPADAHFWTATRFSSLANVGTEFVNATTVDDGSCIDQRTVLIPVAYFVTALIIPTIIVIMCSVLWWAPLQVWRWPRVHSCLETLRMCSGFHILFFAVVLNRFTLPHFPLRMLEEACSEIAPLLDALFGHLFEPHCFSIATNSNGWFVILGVFTMFALCSARVTTRRIEHLSRLVSATVEDAEAEQWARGGGRSPMSTEQLRLGPGSGPSDDAQILTGESATRLA